KGNDARRRLAAGEARHPIGVEAGAVDGVARFEAARARGQADLPSPHLEAFHLGPEAYAATGPLGDALRQAPRDAPKVDHARLRHVQRLQAGGVWLETS